MKGRRRGYVCPASWYCRPNRNLSLAPSRSNCPHRVSQRTVHRRPGKTPEGGPSAAIYVPQEGVTISPTHRPRATDMDVGIPPVHLRTAFASWPTTHGPRPRFAHTNAGEPSSLATQVDTRRSTVPRAAKGRRVAWKPRHHPA